MPDGYDDLPDNDQPAAVAGYDDLPETPKAPGSYDDVPETPGKASRETTIGPYTSPSFFSRALSTIRESFTPLIGPTEAEKFRDSVQTEDGKFVYKPLGDLPTKEGFFPALSHPAVELPKAEAEGDDGLIAAVAKGVYNTGAGFAEFMESPLGVATMGAGSLAMVPGKAMASTKEAIEAVRLTRNLGRTIAGGYAADMAGKIPETAKRAGELSVTGNTQQKVEADLGLGLGVILPASLAGHATELPKLVADKLGANPTPWTAAELKNGKLKEPGAISEFGGDTASAAHGYDDLPSGDSKEATLPERPETVAAQMNLLNAGQRPAVLITPGEVMPELTDQHVTTATPAGTFITRPGGPSAAEIQKAVAENRIGDVLGYGIPAKPSADSAIGAVTVRNKNGVEIQSVATDAENLPNVMAAAQKVKGPGDTVAIEDPQTVIEGRLQGQTSLVADRKNYPVVEVPIKDLKLSADVPNFKADADADTGVVAGQQLEGKYERLGTGAITVYERLDGSQEVISGRHRFDLARRTGEKTVPAQIVREADGFTPAMAMTLDAEMNIRDGQGSVGDYANYFRHSQVTEAQAHERGLLSRVKGQNGWALGRLASDDLFALYRADKITEAQAVAIAQSAPGEAALQRVGSKAAVNGAGAQELKNFIQAVRLKTRSMAPEQFDLFGADDAALNQAQELARVATRLQRELDKEIKSTDNTARNAEAAKAKGIKFERDPQDILKENALLRVQRNQWDNWALHPELVKRVMKESGIDIGEGMGEVLREDETPYGQIPGREQNNPPDERSDVTGGERDRQRIGDAGKPEAANQLPRPGTPTAEEAARIQRLQSELDQLNLRYQQAPHSPSGLGARAQARYTEGQLDEMRSQISRARTSQEISDRLQYLRQESAQLEAEFRQLDPQGAHANMAPSQYGRIAQLRYNDGAIDTLKEQLPGAKLLAKLDSLKINTQGMLFEGVTSLPVHLWNASIDVIKLSVQAGMKLSDAIEHGIAWLKEKYPSVPFDEQEYRRAVNEQYGVREFGEKIKADPDVTPAVKQQVSEYVYEKRTNETDAQAAQRIIAAHGTEEAAKLYLNDRANIPEAVRSILGKTLIKAIGLEEAVARGKGDTAGAERAATRQADLIDADLKRSTEIAQALQAMSVYGDMSPSGVLQHARRVIGAAGDQVMVHLRPVTELIRKGFAKANDAALEDVRQDPAVNGAARAAVNNHIENSPETSRAVVVDVAGAFAQSPEIMRQARALFQGAAEKLQRENPLLANKSKAELGVIFDDLAKRVAGIAASHYQGAELGKTLAQKIAERTGLSEEASLRLAKSMDLQFGKMVEAARKRIPERIAAMRARQSKPFDPNEFSQAGLDREIRRQLQDLNVKLGELVKQHGSQVDATGRSIGERVVSDAGLTGPRADALKAAFDKRFAELAGDKKLSLINQMLKSGIKLPAKLRSAVGDLIKATNIGAFDDAKFYDAVRKKLELPEVTPDLAREITRRANDLQRLPEGFQRDRASAQLLNFIAQAKGRNVYELPMAMWYANTLSGLSTPIHVMLDNVGQLAGNTFVSLLRQPGALRQALPALGRGLVKGALQSAEILKTGIVTGIRDNVYTSHSLEQNPFTGPAKFLNAWKYVGRGLAATHVLTFKPAVELKEALVARAVARQEGLSGPALRQRVADILGNTETRVQAARAQAVAEGNTGLDLRRRTNEIIEQQRETAVPGIAATGRDYGLRTTYLNEPYGVIGNIVKGLNTTIEGIGREHAKLGFLPKLVVPFTRIVGNIVNEKMNWSPVGAFRAARAMRSGEIYGQPISDPTALGDLMTKSIVGTVAVSALTAAAAQYLDDEDPKFAITGNGPASPSARKQLQAAGWHPHSIKLGDRYIDYLRTPAAIPMAVVGNYLDALRYRHLDQTDALNRATLVLKGTADTIVHQSFLDSVAKVFEAVGNENTKSGGQQLSATIARAGSGFVVPNLAMQVDRLFDPTRYDDTDIQSLLRAQIPFVRRMNKPALNVLGEPVTMGVFDRDTGTAKPDELWRVLTEKQAWVPEASKDTIVGDRKRGPDHFRTLTPDELYDYVEESGQRIRNRLEPKLDKIASMEPEQARKFVQQITEEQRKKTLRMFAP